MGKGKGWNKHGWWGNENKWDGTKFVPKDWVADSSYETGPGATAPLEFDPLAIGQSSRYLPLYINNNGIQDGMNVIFLSLDSTDSFSFSKETYVLKESVDAPGTPAGALPNIAPQYNVDVSGMTLVNGTTHPNETPKLVASGPHKEIIVLIEDANSPSPVSLGSGNNIFAGRVGSAINIGINVIYAGPGNDTVFAGASNDTARGEGGNDVLWGENGDDLLIGEAGDDTLYGGNSTSSVTIPQGETGPEQLQGYDYLIGGSGNDKIYGEAGVDVMYGMTGNDFMDGGDGFDVMLGGQGNDTLYGGTGGSSEDGTFNLREYLNGGSGDDFLMGGAGGDRLLGEEGHDKLYGGEGNDNLSGDSYDNINAGSDTIYGESGDDGIGGYFGSDFLSGGTGADSISGDEGNDKLYGNEGNDKLWGGQGADTLDGGLGADTLIGGPDVANDVYVVDNIGDKIVDSPQTGEETVFASISWNLGISYSPNDFTYNTVNPLSGLDFLTLIGSNNINGTGNYLDNVIKGNIANNVLDGKGDVDTLLGDKGNDTLIGGAGADTLNGGEGSDRFVFNFLSEGIDRIEDFNYAEGDKIQVSRLGFGATALSQFAYNQATGALTFNGAQFAMLQSNLGIGFIPSLDIILV